MSDATCLASATDRKVRDSSATWGGSRVRELRPDKKARKGGRVKDERDWRRERDGALRLEA